MGASAMTTATVMILRNQTRLSDASDKRGCAMAFLKPDCSDQELIAYARKLWAHDDLEIDDFGTKVSRAEAGAWVSAWVWIPFDLGEDVDD